MCTATLQAGSVKLVTASIISAAFLGGCTSSTITEDLTSPETSLNAPGISAYPLTLEESQAQILADEATGWPQSVTNSGPAGNSGVSIDNRHYLLDTALGDAWGIYNDVPGDYYNINFTFSDGAFELTDVAIGDETHSVLTPSVASTVIYAEMFHPGDSFSFTGFEFDGLPSNRAMQPETPFFTNAYIGIDFNDDRQVESMERLQIVGGRIRFAGVPPTLLIHFEVILESGQVATGYYTGLINFTNRQSSQAQ